MKTVFLLGIILGVQLSYAQTLNYKLEVENFLSEIPASSIGGLPAQGEFACNWQKEFSVGQEGQMFSCSINIANRTKKLSTRLAQDWIKILKEKFPNPFPFDSDDFWVLRGSVKIDQQEIVILPNPARNLNLACSSADRLSKPFIQHLRMQASENHDELKIELVEMRDKFQGRILVTNEFVNPFPTKVIPLTFRKVKRVLGPYLTIVPQFKGEWILNENSYHLIFSPAPEFMLSAEMELKSGASIQQLQCGLGRNH